MIQIKTKKLKLDGKYTVRVLENCEINVEFGSYHNKHIKFPARVSSLKKCRPIWSGCLASYSEQIYKLRAVLYRWKAIRQLSLQIPGYYQIFNQ